MARPRLLTVLVRNVSLLPTLTVVGIGGALAVAVGLKASTFAGEAFGPAPVAGGALALLGVLVFVLGGLAMLGAIGVLLIAVSAERQRLGDLLAGTWIVRTSGAPGAVPTTRSAPPPPDPPGPDRSG